MHINSRDKDYFYYVCSAKSNNIKCPNCKYLASDKVDDMVWSELVKLAKGTKKLISAQPPKNDIQRRQLENYLIKLKEKQSAMLKWVSAGTISIDDAEIELQNIAKEMTTSRMVLNGLVEIKKPSAIPVQDILSAITFTDKRKVMLKMDIKIHAEKIDGKIKISFTL